MDCFVLRSSQLGHFASISLETRHKRDMDALWRAGYFFRMNAATGHTAAVPAAVLRECPLNGR
jgi:hypothetical protein